MPTVVNMGDVFRFVRLMVELRGRGREAADWLARRLPTEAARRTDWTQSATQDDVDHDFGGAVPQEVAAACRRHVQRAVAQGEPLVRFQSVHAYAEVAAVADWLASLPDEDPSMLAKLPRVTWAQAVEHSRRWHERLARRDADAVTSSALANGTRTAVELDGGWRWVRLETAAALDAEGQAMGHCVGSGGYDSLIKATAPDGIYSCRDARGRPHVTVEVRGGDIQQAQGRGNTAPTGHAGRLGALVQALGAGIGRAYPGTFGLARLDGTLLPVDEALARLAAGDRIVGDVDFGGCTSLTHLPKRMEVGSDLNLRGCTSLVSLPERLEVGKSLDLRDCTSLANLPEGLKVDGWLALNGCTSLVSLPEGLKVGSYLDLSGCTSLVSLPERLEVGKSLGLRDCTSLASYLNLRSCTSLASLPEGLKVGSDLNLRGCTSLVSLPERLEVGKSLGLRDCTSLASLPEGLKVGRSLNLVGCTSLASLPEGLQVGDWLDLRGCSSLKSLPEGLKVGSIYGADHLPRQPAITQSSDSGMTR